MASADAAWEDGNESNSSASADSMPQVEEEENELSRAPTFASGDDASPDDEDDDESGEYDPESVGSSLLPVTAAPVPSKPKKVSGGFLVASSDDEDDEQAPIHSADPGVDMPQSPTLPGHAAAPGQAQMALGRKRSFSGALKSPPMPMTTFSPAPAPVDATFALEARVAEDPRGDMDAWLGLIAEHRSRHNPEDIRAIYSRFLEVFPQSADIWVEWIEWELSGDNFVPAESLFGRSLLSVPNIRLWTVYLNYIRRRNDLSNDVTGQARRTVTQSYEFVIDNIGHDKDSGKIWSDYIQFIKSAPGNIGGTNWQDQQKMDQLRKAYQRAIAVPMSAVNTVWKEYDQFEMGLNKLTGRKFIQERSPTYMSAKSSSIALDNMTRNLRRETIPRLPPAPGFAGDVEYMEQVTLWKRWIEWEIEDPLALKSDEPTAYHQRVLYCLKQALMAMRFWPELWVEAAEWCFKEKGLKEGREQGVKFLLQGIEANPESVLLAFKHGDHVERTHPEGDDDDAKTVRVSAVRAPYDKVLGALYDMVSNAKEKEKVEIAKVEAEASGSSDSRSEAGDDGEDDYGADDARDGDGDPSSKKSRMAAISGRYDAQIRMLSRTISFVWIALARAMRRIQGKGSAKEGGLRKVFTDARQRGRLTSDVYVAVALIESTVYKDPVGAKIFERGAKLFPEDENFILEYIKYLHSRDDTTNARVLFEQCVNRLIQNPDNVVKAKVLYHYFHKYESQYGELAQVIKLEERMEELFPEDPRLQTFASRYSSDKFDAIATRIIVSPAVQLRPKGVFFPEPMQNMVREATPAQYQRREPSPRPQIDSPKRPLEDDTDYGRPRKIARGESPLKGAAGRRLDQQRRNQAPPLELDITFLLGILPPAHQYDFLKFSPHKMAELLRSVNLPGHEGGGGGGSGHARQPSGSDYPYGRRDSPNPSARARSPYEGNAVARVAASGYRNSPLRPDGYGAPAAGYDAGPVWPPAPGMYGVPPNPYGGRPPW